MFQGVAHAGRTRSQTGANANREVAAHDVGARTARLAVGDRVIDARRARYRRIQRRQRVENVLDREVAAVGRIIDGELLLDVQVDIIAVGNARLGIDDGGLVGALEAGDPAVLHAKGPVIQGV